MGSKRKAPAKRRTAAKRKTTGKGTTGKGTRTNAKRKKAAKRTLISPRGDKRYIRRDSQGRIKESDDVSRSLSRDQRTKAKRKAPKGQGDRGD